MNATEKNKTAACQFDKKVFAVTLTGRTLNLCRTLCETALDLECGLPVWHKQSAECLLAKIDAMLERHGGLAAGQREGAFEYVTVPDTTGVARSSLRSPAAHRALRYAMETAGEDEQAVCGWRATCPKCSRVTPQAMMHLAGPQAGWLCAACFEQETETPMRLIRRRKTT